MFKQKQKQSPSQQPDVVPVYIQSEEHCWVPALQLKTHDGMAKITVPKFKNEADMMNCAPKSKHFKYHDNQMVSLKDYVGNTLPMQNVDRHGNVEDFKDMVDLPFMHEVSRL